MRWLALVLALAPAVASAGVATSPPAAAAEKVLPPPGSPPPTPVVPVATLDPESAVISAEPGHVKLGQPFTLTATLRHDPSIRYELPDPLTLGTLSVRDVSVERQPGLTTIRATVAIYDALGATTLPGLTLHARSASGSRQITLSGASITVDSSTDKDELEEIRPPQDLRVADWTMAWIGAGVVAAVALLFFGWRWWKRFRAAHAHEVEPMPQGTPEERALAALDGLAAEAPTRDWYFRLSEVVRTFLEEVTGLAAREMTNRELVDALVLREQRGLSVVAFSAWLDRGDLIRFAKLTPDAARAGQDLEEAKGFVRGVAAALPKKEEEAA